MVAYLYGRGAGPRDGGPPTPCVKRPRRVFAKRRHDLQRVLTAWLARMQGQDVAGIAEPERRRWNGRADVERSGGSGPDGAGRRTATRVAGTTWRPASVTGSVPRVWHAEGEKAPCEGRSNAKGGYIVTGRSSTV